MPWSLIAVNFSDQTNGAAFHAPKLAPLSVWNPISGWSVMFQIVFLLNRFTQAVMIEQSLLVM